jgi:hypothetical protein
MSRWTVCLLLLALALPASGVASVRCDPAAGPMPCCQNEMSDCAQAGVVADCCSLVPAQGDRAAAAHRTAAEHEPVAAVLVPIWTALLLGEITPLPVATLPSAAPPYRPPVLSRTTVLRI